MRERERELEREHIKILGKLMETLSHNIAPKNKPWLDTATLVT